MSSNKRSVTLVALAAASVAVIVWMRAGDDDPETPPPAIESSNPAAVPAPRDADARALERRADVAQQSATPGSASATAQTPGPMVVPSQPPPVALPLPTAPALAANPETNRPIDILLTAPVEANNGSTVEIGLGVTAESLVQSAVFHLSYDPAVLEPLDIGAANPTAPSPANGALAELEFRVQLQEGTMQWPVIRFITHTETPQSTEITVSGQTWDGAGNAMAMGPPASQTIILWP